jgi:hypothetical protein
VALKYWEIIADKLSAAGWTWGCSSSMTPAGLIFTVDAHRSVGARYIVHSDEKLTAFLELESICQAVNLPL